MPDLTVETGSNVTGANSFISLDDADTYFEDRGDTTWSATGDDAKEQALVRAVDYLDSLNWKGYRTNETQPLCWPRSGVKDRDGYSIDIDDIPQVVKDAQCEAAKRELTTGTLQPDIVAGGQPIRERVDVVEVEYAKGATPRKQFTKVSEKLKGLVYSSTVVEVVRA